jgi:hypothetical protein
MVNGSAHYELRFIPLQFYITGNDEIIPTITLPTERFASGQSWDSIYLNSLYFKKFMCDMFSKNKRFEHANEIDVQELIKIAREEARLGASREDSKGRSYVSEDKAWCAMFVTWVAKKAGVAGDDFPTNSSTGVVMHEYIIRGRFRLSISMQLDAKSVLTRENGSYPNHEGSGYSNHLGSDYHTSREKFRYYFSWNMNATLYEPDLEPLLYQAYSQPYLPKQGDLIIFRNYYPGKHHHIGIVEALVADTVHTIEGNTPGSGSRSMVNKKQYKLDAVNIMGYCQNGGTSFGSVV